jgi:neutral ceramidase
MPSLRFCVVFVVVLTSLGCPGPVTPPPPEPGPLRAGVATRKLDQPVGIAMGGYLRNRPASDPGSPWAQQFPASRGVHTEPTVRVVALTNGLTRVAFIRLDTTIVSPTLRSRLIASLSAAGESAKVFLFATHTHAGPARFMPPARLGSSTGTDFVSLVMDHYDAELEAHLTDAIVAATTGAFASLVPVSVGVSTIEAGDFNNDRRCENDPIYGHDFRDTAMTMIRLDEVDAAGQPVKPLTALMHYAMHGTVLPSDNTLQSTEAPGALELYASDAVGVPVMYVQGAAGDVSPAGSPFGHSDLQQLERQGRAAAKLAAAAYAQAAPGAAPAKQRLDFLERGVSTTREAIGYAMGEFPEYGGIQCAAGGPGACGAVKSEPKDVVCLPLARRPAGKTPLSMLRIGDELLLLSLPGEPGTGLSRKIQAALAPLGATRALTVGYSQDHFGYLLEEDDWLRGGYEPTVSAYGWKFGPYLLSEVEAFVASIDQSQPPADVLEVTAPTFRSLTDSMAAPSVVTEPQDGERLSTHVFEFEGGDPGLGLPQVSLERREGAGFVPVMASATRAVINGPELLIRYASEPTFKADPTATVRRHRWTVQFETVPSAALGEYRLVARGVAKVGGAKSSYELISRGFTVTKSTAVVGRARMTMDGRFALEARFPPNPTVHAADIDDVVLNYRVRDLNSDPRVGALARGAMGSSVQGALINPDSSMSAVTLTWSDAEAAWVSAPLAAGTYRFDVAAGGVVDAQGNENGAAVSVSP